MLKNFIMVLCGVMFTLQAAYSMDPVPDEAAPPSPGHSAAAGSYLEPLDADIPDFQQRLLDVKDGKDRFLDPVVALLRKAAAEGLTQELRQAAEAIMTSARILGKGPLPIDAIDLKEVSLPSVWYVFVYVLSEGDFSYFRQKKGKIVPWEKLDPIVGNVREVYFRSSTGDYPAFHIVDFLVRNTLGLAEKYNDSEHRRRDFWYALHYNDTTPMHWAHLLQMPYDPGTHVPFSVLAEISGIAAGQTPAAAAE